MKKRGKSFINFKIIIEKLARNELLEPKYRDHKLTGNYSGTRECHVEPDWLLIYIDEPDELLLIRTGTHSDLFN
ncbi:MAG: type II toxin-antitoxin system YafQ family toxin [Candidatus Cyclonatronum sp.]|uniref:type II toxin-antitoxin system YafQ family toxin n=1 Tax=Cyclonatronum sp. TaxID=3024185 RepID=UPI0025C33620|nr:type II toxin-antitoxin system YafQ family toxin [Cyclonatronum sp.]MCC5933382.1 type II toxin-antitoxin system YafQ family toxin [Balneolales bacterium]MCH8487571.1 type II toxin-antitoxin system YafQ family toxin [Cyclonatronum sp.]